ncbi:MAG: SIMPL domain-containing protein [Clostridia bacterium]|jgi:uncharacterized protein YggE|nr:SIMPL domain-containing protein [Clostridia bacterium]MBQ9289436.1 SIMPL domain-containing protein [Clostridia bacterium]MBR0216687.1 SIMPL domain-containing protein [Clostridia bacterium]
MKNRIFALLLALCLLLTAAATAEETRKIVVTGTATVSVEADRAILSLGVRSTADDAARASAENATAVEALKTALTNAGIQAGDITTSYYYVSPMYDYSSSDMEKVLGYQVNHVLNVLVKDLDRTGEMIDLALASGASTCDGVSFQSSQASAAYDQALVTAIKEGRRKAELMALGCGRILGELVLVEENYGDYGGALVARSEASMDKGAGTQIVSNSLSYSATVTMTFLMQ